MNTKKSPFLNSPTPVLVENFPYQANLFPEYKMEMVYNFTKYGDPHALPHFFEIYRVKIQHTGNEFFYASHTHLAPQNSQDVHTGKSFEYYIDARAWLLSESFGIK